MCGRFSFVNSKEKVKKTIKNVVFEENEAINSYNIAPTNAAYIITDENPDLVQQAKWGLIPSWSKDGKMQTALINARVESIFEKPSFREAALNRHCLVLADSFYEWKTYGKGKIPYRILLENEHILVMAGIWERWNNQITFSILTTESNEEMSSIHNRMPIILLDEKSQNQWLFDKNSENMRHFLSNLIPNCLKMYPISPKINAVGNNSDNLHEPIIEQKSLFD